MKKGAWVEVPAGTKVCQALWFHERVVRSKRSCVVQIAVVGWAYSLRSVPGTWRPPERRPPGFFHLVAWRAGGIYYWCRAVDVRELHDLEALALAP